MNERQSRTGDQIPVNALKPQDAVLQFFQVRSKELRKTRSGQDYLDLVLGDATGTISAKLWSDALRRWGHEFGPGDFVKVEGRVDTYRDAAQLIVDKIRRAETDEIPDPSGLIRTCKESADDLFAELRSMAESLEPAGLAQLLVTILEGNQEAIKMFPAAQMIHHAYRGGFVEHVVAVVRKVEALLTLEPAINRNIAIAGAILHDIGKIRELHPTGQGRTAEGRLLGHIVLGVSLVREAAVELDVRDKPWLSEIVHIILSHHGETQFGSPVRPLTREAILVHFVDNLDAKLKIVDDALQSAGDDGFSPYNRWLEGRAFAGIFSMTQEEDDAGTAGEISGDPREVL